MWEKTKMFFSKAQRNENDIKKPQTDITEGNE